MRRAWQWFYRLYAVRRNVVLGRSVHIGLWSILAAATRLTVGDDVYIGKNCTIEVDGSIGSGVLIANNVGLLGRRDHDYTCVGKRVRHSPWIGDADFDAGIKAKRLVVEDDVWIGFGAIVLSGITVGRGSVVAAGSIVTRDVAPYSIVAGNPARRVGERFNAEEIARHEALLGLEPRALPVV
jgi:acetyltransferase-like isoleucine patch superfamily enzyme